MTKMADAFSRLDSLLDRRFSVSEHERSRHGASETHFSGHTPDAVVWPRSTAEVAAIVEIARESNLPLIGFGAGTSLEGQTAAPNGGIAVNFANMDRILRIRPEDMDVTLQPGVTREALNAQLRDTGLFFPVDPGANATLGGMASTRASGTTTVKYGTMRDNVRALEVVLADGRVIRTGSRAAKSASGYDLTGLFIGAEGTLGLITELTLQLHGQPEAMSVARCGFGRIEDAVRTATEAIQAGLALSRIELVDADTVRAVNAYSDADLPEMPHLLVEAQGSAVSVANDAREFGEIVADNDGASFQWSSLPEERTALWSVRHNAFWAIKAANPGKIALVTDVCVPISRLSETILETQGDILAAAIPGPIVGHVGDGNFHVALMIDPARPTDMDQAQRLSDRMVSRALAVGGTATGEHGVGMGKTAYMAREHGAAWEVMGDIKQALDPQNIMNPGKIVSPIPG